MCFVIFIVTHLHFETASRVNLLLFLPGCSRNITISMPTIFCQFSFLGRILHRIQIPF